MAGSWGPSKAFLQRRKKRASSRRWAVMSKRLQETPKPIVTPVITQLGNCDPITQTSPVPLLGVRGLLLAFGRVCQIWRNCLSQSFSGFLKTFFFWRGYAKQLETLQNQMAELQREMDALHSALQGSSTACHCHGTVAGGLVRPMFPTPPPLPLGCGSSVDPLPALTPPVPAPPPPPPPPPPSTTFLQPYVPKKRVASNGQQSSKEKQDILVAVTLRDLQTVKLRKVIVSSVKSKRTPEKIRTPLVTVADLQNVRLKRSHCQLLPKCISTGRTPSKNPMSLRTQLKRVQINRSPGGTPLFDKENMEAGTGLTPIMTQALQRKFQNALPRGPSPKAKNCNGSFDNQN